MENVISNRRLKPNPILHGLFNTLLYTAEGEEGNLSGKPDVLN